MAGLTLSTKALTLLLRFSVLGHIHGESTQSRHVFTLPLSLLVKFCLNLYQLKGT